MILHSLAELDIDEVLGHVLAQAPDGVVVVDGSGRIVLVNDRAVEMFGYDGDGLLGRSVDELVPSASRDEHRALRTDFQASPAARPMRGYGALNGLRHDGTEFPVEISLSPVSDTAQPLVVAIVRDVSARLETEARVDATQRELQLTTERERIARDLHDTIIQELFATGMSLQAIVGRVEDDLARKRLTGAIDSLDDCIRRIRTVIFGLTAHSAWGRGLRGEILKVAADEARALGFEPAVSFRGTVDALDEPYGSHVVAVVREAVSNIARHAKASAASIDVRVDDELLVTVADNGVGLPEHVTERSGLTNLRSRAEELGGTLEVESSRDSGTVIELRVPLP